MTVANRLYDVLYGSRGWTAEHGDCRALLRLLPDGCVDAVVTDPPYELGFMSRGWDRTGIAFDVGMWREVLRVCKPGAHVLSFGGTRTHHRMACAIEDAGFDMRDQIDWLYGQGFPKSLNISKALDKAAGAEGEIVGEWRAPGRGKRSPQQRFGLTKESGVERAPATAAAAAALQGWGTALKPSHEPIAMAMKPLDGTFRENVLRHGVGPIHVDACRITASGRRCVISTGGKGELPRPGLGGTEAAGQTSEGRWPANNLFSHSEGCQLVGSRKVKAAPAWNDNRPASLFTGGETSPVRHADDNGMETVEDWRCVDGCPVGALDEQSVARGIHPSGSASDGSQIRNTASPGYSGGFGVHSTFRRGDSGTSSRFFTQFPYEPFFYEPKADTEERERGVEWMGEEIVDDGRHTANDTPYQRGKTKRKNIHTTVKPAAVVRWLSRLVCPAGGLILDPFAGSGTGGIAALAEGMRWIGLELIGKHAEIARARIVGDSPLFNLASGGGRGR